MNDMLERGLHAISEQMAEELQNTSGLVFWDSSKIWMKKAS